MLSICKSLPNADLPFFVRVRESTTRLLVDFCTRHHNVNARPKAVDIAWRKAIRPQMTRTGDVAELLRFASHVGCAPLAKLCVSDLAPELRSCATTAAIRSRFVDADAGEPRSVVLAETMGPRDLQSVLEKASSAPPFDEGHAWLQEARACDLKWMKAVDALLARQHREMALGLSITAAELTADLV